MAKPRHLVHAPITEAVIDLRADVHSDFDVTVFRSLKDAVGYPTMKDIKAFAFRLQHQPGKQPEPLHVDHGIIGIKFETVDDLQIAQFRKDGFTFSRLAPYTRWEEVFAEASRLCRVFLEAASPDEVSRLAVRYINRLPLPAREVGDFSEFLTAPPPFPKKFEVFLTGFLTQVQIQEPESRICGTIVQTIQGGTSDSAIVPIILDLDIYDSRTCQPEPTIVLPRFAALREAKNRYFFGSITEKTADLFV